MHDAIFEITLNNSQFIIKFSSQELIENEGEIYTLLMKDKSYSKYIPQMIYYGIYNEFISNHFSFPNNSNFINTCYCIIVKKLVGAQLNKCNYKKHKSLIIQQVLKILNFLQINNIVHNDIKPDHFIFDENACVLKCIDFGLAKIKSKNKKQLTSKFSGNILFCSLNAHRLCERSFTDDLESTLYTLAYLQNDEKTPWEINGFEYTTEELLVYTYTLKHKESLQWVIRNMSNVFTKETVTNLMTKSKHKCKVNYKKLLKELLVH